MNQHQRISDEQVEPLVRSFLEQEAHEVDVQANLAAIVARLANTASEPLTETADGLLLHRSAVRWIARLAVAACLVVAVGVGAYLAISPEPANAYALVKDAQAVVNKPADRCYRVATKVPRAWLKSSPFLSSGDESLVWTRGDRFRVTTVNADGVRVWGQDDQRRLWIVCDPDNGLRFDRDEVPPNFARTRAYLGLDVRRLTSRFLEHFDLRIEKAGRSDDKKVVIVQANAKEDRQSLPFNYARLEIEVKTKIIRKMELKRIVDGVVKGNFTFTLIDVAAQPETIYQLESNLAPAARIYGNDDPHERKQRLNELIEAKRGS